MRISGRLLIESGPGEARALLIEGARLVEIAIARSGRDSRIGDIHLARITRLAPGAAPGSPGAFVDLGRGVPGFLPLAGDAAEGGWRLVQIVKDAQDGKAAEVRERLEITGALLTLVLGVPPEISVARKIPGTAERGRLRAVLQGAAQSTESWVARLEAAGQTEARLLYEIELLRRRAAVLDRAAAQPLAAGPVLTAPGSLDRLLTTLAHERLDEIIVAGPGTLAAARDWCAGNLPIMAERLRAHPVGQGPLIDAELEAEIAAACEPVVPLPGGGRLTLSITPALVALDVDLAGAADPAAVNLAALDAAARQIRLRGLGGQILIDFIRVGGRLEREKLLDQCRTRFAQDPEPVTLHGWTRGGLLELGRARGRRPLHEMLETICPACHGSGRVADPRSVALGAVRAVLAAVARDPAAGAPIITAPAEVADALAGLTEARAEAQAQLGQALSVEADFRLPAGRFEIHRRGRI